MIFLASIAPQLILQVYIVTTLMPIVLFKTAYMSKTTWLLSLVHHSASYGFRYGANLQSSNFINEMILKRNVFYLSSGSSSNQNYGIVGTTPYATISDFQTAFPGKEVGSISVNPQYTNPATGDFTPLNYALYGNGTNALADVPLDINGKIRSTAPTPGAFGWDWGRRCYHAFIAYWHVL